MGQKEKQARGKFLAKHETEENWNKSSYVPAQGEHVVYDPDPNNPIPRVKYGNGTNIVKDLPFVIESGLKEESDPTVPAHVKAISEQDISNWNEKFDQSDLIQEVASSIEKADETKTVSEKALVERFALTAEGLCQNYLLTTPGWKRIMVMTRGQSGQLNLNLGHNNAESRIFQNLGLTIGGYVNFPNGAYGSSYGTYARNGDNSMPTIYQVYNNEFGDDVNKYPERRARIAKVRMGYPVPGTDYEQINDDGSVTTTKLTNPINCYFDIYVDFDVAIAARSGVQLQVSYSGKSNNNGVEPIVSETDATDIGIKKEQLTYFEFEPKLGVNLYDPNYLNILNELESKNIKSNSIEANIVLADSIQQKTETVSTLGTDKLEIYSNKKKAVNPTKVTYTISDYDATNPPRIDAYRKYNMLYKSHLSLYGSYTRPSGVIIESFQDGTFTINTNGNTTSSAEVFSNSRYASVFNGLESDSFKGSDEDKMIYLPAGKYVVINCQIYDETGAVIANGGLGTGRKFTTTSDKWVSLAIVHVPKNSKLNGSIRYVPILMQDQGATYYTAQLNTKTNMVEIVCQPEEDSSWTITFPVEELFSTSYKAITGYSNGNYVIDIENEQMFKDDAITNDASEALKMFKEVTKDYESGNPYVTYYNIAKTGSYTFYNSIGVDLIEQLNNKLESKMDKNPDSISIDGDSSNIIIGAEDDDQEKSIAVHKYDGTVTITGIEIDARINDCRATLSAEGFLDLVEAEQGRVMLNGTQISYTDLQSGLDIKKLWSEVLSGSGGGSDIDLSAYLKKTEAKGYSDILTKTEAQLKYQPKGNYIKQDEVINLGADSPEHATLTSTSLDFTNDDSAEYSILDNSRVSFWDDNEGVESYLGLHGLSLSSHADSYFNVVLDNIQGTSVDGSDDIKQSFQNFLEVPTKISQLTNDSGYITSSEYESKEFIELNNTGKLKGYGGYIDFHYHAADGTPSANTDYSSRIIEIEDGALSINDVILRGSSIVEAQKFNGYLEGTAAKATQIAINQSEYNGFLPVLVSNANVDTSGAYISSGNKVAMNPATGAMKIQEIDNEPEYGSTSTNHKIVFGGNGKNKVEIYEYGGEFNVWQSQAGVNTKIFGVSPSEFTYNGNNVIHGGNIGAQSVNYANSAGSANYLSTYGSVGEDNIEALKNIFDTVPKSVGTAVRLEKGLHSMALGWFLSGYSKDEAYGGWFISDYGTPSWVGVNNGEWKSSQFITTENIGSQSVSSASYATSAYSAENANWSNWSGGADVLKANYTFDGGAQPPSYVGANSVKCNMMNQFLGCGGFEGYADVLMMNGYHWAEVPYATALAIQKTNGIPRAWIAAGGETDHWAGATELITTNNIGSQTVNHANTAGSATYANYHAGTGNELIHTGNIGGQSVNYAASANYANSAGYASSAGSAPASDVYPWAKAASKPSYSWSEITNKPSSFGTANAIRFDSEEGDGGGSVYIGENVFSGYPGIKIMGGDSESYFAIYCGESGSLSLAMSYDMIENFINVLGL